MIQLFLNEQEVHIQTNSSIKLIKENPLLTKNGSSTYNISIPMTDSENLKVLGHLNRIDYLHKTVTFAAKLMCNSVTLIVGEAIITEVTEDVVKVQILGGTSLMNFYNRMETIYIDELDLGKWGGGYIGMDVTNHLSYGFFYTQVWTNYIFTKAREGADKAQEYLISTLFGGNDWVAFPIYNETSEVMCNDWVFRVLKDSEGNWNYGVNGLYLEPRNNIDDGTPNGYPQVRFAIQPYLLPMIKRVFRALGYSIDISSIENNKLFSKLFIASAHEYSAVNKSLPHWSVKEFIQQLEYFLGVVFVCDENSKSIVVIRRTDYVKQEQYVIEDVIDEFTVSNDEDEIVALTSMNIGYAEVDKYARLEPWILEKAKQKHYADFVEMTNDILQFNPDNVLTTYQDYYNEYKGHLLFNDQTGEIYIAKAPDYFSWLANTAFVHHFRDRISRTDNNEVDVELKIVPVNMMRGALSSYYAENAGKDQLYWNIGGYYSYMSVPDYPVRRWEEPVTTNENLISDIDMAINGEETLDESNRDDILRVAINDNAFTLHTVTGLGNDTFNHRYPKAIVYSNGEYDINAEITKGNIGLNLHNVTGKTSLATEVFDVEPKMNTKTLYCIKFIASKVLNVDYKFIIRNQAYVCKKLEYQAKESGLEKIVTGYFYRLEE